MSSTAFLPLGSVTRAAASPIAQFGVTAFFIAGLAESSLGGWAPWFVLGAALIGALVRAVDIESWGLLVPGGLQRAVRQAVGRDASRVVMVATLVERLLLGLLADGHLLVEGLPGLAKTRAIKALAKNLDAKLSRIQFTPDLPPSDVTGSVRYDPSLHTVKEIDRLTETWRETDPPTTFTAGVALHWDGEAPSETLARADRALYEAKRSGRDRVQFAEATALAADLRGD